MIQRFIRRLTALALLLSLGACDGLIRNELDDIQRQIEELYALTRTLNNDISSLSSIVGTLQEGDYVVDVTPYLEKGVEVGQAITFLRHGTIVIYHGKDGASGETPLIGVRQDGDGVWYWTVNGTWLLDSGGRKVQAAGRDGKDGITPQVKIEDYRWYVSLDGGKTWGDIGPETGSGTIYIVGVDAESSPDHVIFTTDGGVELLVPRYKPFSIAFDLDEDNRTINPGETLPIQYTLSGEVSDDFVVTVSSDGNYTAAVSKSSTTTGVISVRCPNVYVDGYVNVLVDDGHGRTGVRVINFTRRNLVFSDGLTYYADKGGQTIAIPFSSNFDYSLSFRDGCDSWISLLQTRADISGTIKLSVGPNPLSTVRTGYIDIRPHNNPDVTIETITVIQASATFSVTQTSVNALSDGGTYPIGITSSRGVDVRIPEEAASWLSGSVEDKGSDVYSLTLTVVRNYGSEIRSTTIDIYTADGSQLQGTISVTQLSSATDSSRDFVLEVSANFPSDFQVALPLHGEMDCYIQWGDGESEWVRRTVEDREWITHKYSVSEATRYDVRVSGLATRLRSEGIPTVSAIRAVKQWGDLGFQSVEFGFHGCSSLTSVATDALGAFANVTDMNNLFSQCISLTGIPAGLFDACKQVKQIDRTFEGCLSVAFIPEGLFDACAQVESFDSTFHGCRSITSVPDNLFAHCEKVISFASTFSDCRSLKEIPEGLFASCPDVASFHGAFSSCFSLRSIPAGLFAHNPKVTSFYQTFTDCRSLYVIPVSIFDNNRRVDTFEYVFFMINAEMEPMGTESPYTVIKVDGQTRKVHLYERQNYPDYFVVPTAHAFALSDTRWIDADQIPDDWQ